MKRPHQPVPNDRGLGAPGWPAAPAAFLAAVWRTGWRALGIVLVTALGMASLQAQVIFSENVGTPSSTTQVNSYTGWQNGAPVNFSSSVNTDVRTTVPSVGYTGASGGGNVFFGTGSGNNKDLLISGINTNGYINITLSFGLLWAADPGSSLSVSVSSDGVNWTSLSFLQPPSKNLWVRTTASGTIPATSNLRIKFEKNSTAQYRVDDIELTGTLTGPLVNFNLAASSHDESDGLFQVDLTINPVAAADGSITITIGGASTATYGVTDDYETTPAAAGGITITIPVDDGDASAHFTVSIVDDALQEANETIIFTITGTTGGLNIGSTHTHTFTIQDNDYYPTVEFATTSIAALEGAGAQTFTVNFSLPHPPSFTITIQVTNGPGAVYGVGNDYTTNPVVGGGTFTMGPFSGAAASGSFTATPLTDGIPEGTEWVSFTIISVSNPTIQIGANSTATLYIGDIDSPPATLDPGDLVLVGVNANEGACGGTSGEDRISFFCFKEITYGTELIITDNGYERCNPGQWGNQEGTVRLVRNGPAIPPGQVVTFSISNLTGSGNITGLAPDAAWTCTNVNTPSGGGGINAVNLNVNGDQLFFMQGGTWSSGSNLGNNATYDGSVLYGFSTNPTHPWAADCSTDPNRRSNLPTGVECFSTAPTLASDFNKYTGPLTAATQRDWIIRLDNVTNWSSYSSCSQYNTTGPDWMAAPILPIINSPMTHGLWRGAVNTDWFDCKNWDDARIPDASTDVVINNLALRACDVGLATGLNPGGTAQCASLLQITTPSSKNLVIQPNSTLNVGGIYKMDNTGGASILAVVSVNSTLNADSVVIKGSSPSSTSILRASAAGSLIQVTGNLTIDVDGQLDLQTSTSDFGTLNLGGDFVNKDDEANFRDAFSTVNFIGTGDQYIRNNNPLENFHDLRVNKPSGDVYLTAPIAVRRYLDLIQGRIFSSPTAMITLASSGSVVSAGDASFVHGPFERIGTSSFTFPIGKEHSYRPATVSGITGASDVAFTAEYFHHPGPGGWVPGNPIGNAHDATLDHASDCEHWRIDRSNGAPNATITLSWRAPESCGVTFPPDMRVAYWDGSLWVDRGGSPITGNSSVGTVATATVQSSFLQAANYWTLASLSNENPLPIELLEFGAQANQDHVDLFWATASERDNDFFTVERSGNNVEFSALTQVPGAGNSQAILHYRDVDPYPLTGLNYYRLRQTDFDGTSRVSEAVPVFFRGGPGRITVLYGDNGLFVEHGFTPGSTLQIMDAMGRVVAVRRIVEEGLVRLPMDGLAHGAYVLRLTDGREVQTARFAY